VCVHVATVICVCVCVCVDAFPIRLALTSIVGKPEVLLQRRRGGGRTIVPSLIFRKREIERGEGEIERESRGKREREC